MKTSSGIYIDHARPWMRALEMQYSVLRAINTALRVVEDWDEQSGISLACHEAALVLPKSEAFAWSKDTATAVLCASRTIPDTAILSADMLPARACWWWFEDPLPLAESASVSPDDPAVDYKHLAALSVASYDNGDLLVIMYRPFENEMVFPVSALRIRPTTILGDIFTPGAFQCAGVNAANAPADEHDVIQRTADVLRFVLAACAWLKQRILVCSTGHVERHRRKQLARENNGLPPNDIKVVELRRLESSSHQPHSSTEDVAWSCRWIVNGHWRNQPYKDGRKLIYIMPFVKGPADMPLKVPTHVVYQVNR